MKKPLTRLVSRTAGPLRSLAVRHFNRQFERDERGMFFIFGHMRSGSTLLTNLLLAHPDLYGYGETHRTYHTAADFGRAVLNIAWVRRALPKRERWVIDKVLHHRMTPDHAVLTEGRVLFLLREPASALSSIVRMRGQPLKVKGAVAYYTERVEEIAAAAATLAPERWDFATYRDLVHHTDDAFARVERLLELKTPLREEYEHDSSTGISHAGDHSDHIKTGRILRDLKRDLAPGVEPFLPAAEARYRETLATLAHLKGRPLEPTDSETDDSDA